VWDEFASDPARLGAIAEAIRAGVTIQDRRVEVTVVEESDEEEFPEGRIIYRLHRARERNRALVERKKARVLAQHGRLSCEVCGFDFAAIYGSLGDGYIECHHAVALHESPEERRSRLEDLVLVCSNCHRMIHRKRPWLDAASARVMLLQSVNLRSVTRCDMGSSEGRASELKVVSPRQSVSALPRGHRESARVVFEGRPHQQRTCWTGREDGPHPGRLPRT
jgi:5-methylcytosine-specific restriction endonuclease McrA